MPAEKITVRDLRRLWKPQKERLNGQAAEHPTAIRFHRACSWMERAEQAIKDDLDLAILSQWVAFNALYGQWNHEAQEPCGKRASQSKKTMYDARTWFIQGNWLLILDRLLERIYFLRCQLVHGASTFNGSLNRTAIRHCSQAMDHLLRAFLQVWISFGPDEDWGIMCYPPLRSNGVQGKVSTQKA